MEIDTLATWPIANPKIGNEDARPLPRDSFSLRRLPRFATIDHFTDRPKRLTLSGI